MIQAIKCKSCDAPLNLDKTRNGLCKCEFCNVEHNLTGEITAKCKLNDVRFSRILYRILLNNFSLEELEDIVYMLATTKEVAEHNLDWEHIRGDVKPRKCRELIEWFMRRDMLQILVDYLINIRPLIIFELQ